MSITYAYAGDIDLTKSAPDENGFLDVYGLATSPREDLDEQVCDPVWLKSAVPDWYQWANVRAMHGPIAAGVGKELEVGEGDRWWLKSKVVDQDSINKVREGVYKGYSVGIKNAKVIKDAKARGGRIVSGQIVEISLVDRPCNPDAVMSIAKAHGAALAPVDMAGVVIAKFDEPDGTETEIPATLFADTVVTDMSKAADEPFALDGKAVAKVAVPKAVKTTAVLTPRAYKAAVATVAKVLAGEFGTAGVLTKAAGTNDETGDIAGAWAAIGVICDLVISEATELKTGRTEEIYDIKTLTDALCALTWFIDCEKMQDGSPAGPLTVDTDAVVAAVDMAVEADVTKSVELQVDADGVETEPDFLADESTPVVKSAPVEPAVVVPEAAPAVEPVADIVKTKWTQAKRDAAEQAGHAMPGGKYPIEDASDVDDAVGLVGHGLDSKKKIRDHIMAQAGRVGAMDKIPDPWKTGAAPTKPAAASKSAEVETTKVVDTSTNPADTVPTTTPDEGVVAEYVAKAVTKATAASEERIKALEAEIAKVKATPVPGGPFILPPPQPVAATTNKSEQAQRFRLMADQASDPGIASAYRAKAREVESNKD